jgi:hypothetical protein
MSQLEPHNTVTSFQLCIVDPPYEDKKEFYDSSAVKKLLEMLSPYMTDTSVVVYFGWQPAICPLINYFGSTSSKKWLKTNTTFGRVDPQALTVVNINMNNVRGANMVRCTESAMVFYGKNWNSQACRGRHINRCKKEEFYKYWPTYALPAPPYRHSGALNVINGYRGRPRAALQHPVTRKQIRPNAESHLMLPMHLLSRYLDRGDAVLDLTAGTLTTALAAMERDVKCVAIEVDEDCIRHAKARLMSRAHALTYRYKTSLGTILQARMERAKNSGAADTSDDAEPYEYPYDVMCRQPLKYVFDRVAGETKYEEYSLEQLAAHDGVEVAISQRLQKKGREKCQGLFAKRDIVAGEVVCSVTGKWISRRTGRRLAENGTGEVVLLTGDRKKWAFQLSEKSPAIKINAYQGLSTTCNSILVVGEMPYKDFIEQSV